MSIDYAVKIPLMSTMYGLSDLDIERIVSATSSSGTASNLSSARSHKASSVFGEIGQPGAASMHRMASFVDNNKIPLSFKQRRIPSANKRLPWDQQPSTEGSEPPSPAARARDAAPLKAFPLTDDTLEFKSSYAQASSYQEKYLKKLGNSGSSSTRGSFSGSKGASLDSQSQIIDNSGDSELYETARRQSDKYFSLDNLYNIDDTINSENSIQKRKLANLNVKSKRLPDVFIGLEILVFVIPVFHLLEPFIIQQEKTAFIVYYKEVQLLYKFLLLKVFSLQPSKKTRVVNEAKFLIYLCGKMSIIFF